MTETSSRFALPLLQSGQAQKEIYHNEAITRLDTLIHPAVEDIGVDEPPATPSPGQCWIVGAAASGDWAGQTDMLACWTGGGWRFIAPRAGLLLWWSAETRWVWHDGNSWLQGDWPVAGVSVDGVRVIGARQPSVTDPAGGVVIDAEARSALLAVLFAMREHGLIEP